MKISSLFLGLTLLISATAQAAPEPVAINISNIPAGGIVIRESERALYLKIDESRAIRYRVAVPRKGMSWVGQSTYIADKRLRPAWFPPRVVTRAKPHLNSEIGAGASNNPMGAAAMPLGLHEIAIHGTTQAMRASIGTAASFGCIRMFNEDILDLYQRVGVGTPVTMVP